MEQWQASGKSAAAFAAEQGFSATRLAYWTKQIAAVAPKGPRFVAVPIAARIPTRPRNACGVEIEVDGLTLRVGDDVDVRYVARLVAALRTRGAERC
jgi:hypothetical protein